MATAIVRILSPEHDGDSHCEIPTLSSTMATAIVNSVATRNPKTLTYSHQPGTFCTITHAGVV